MGRHHQFHADHGGHSITVTVRSGVSREVDLLVDGKEVVHLAPRGAGTTLVAGELPDDPPLPFRVTVHQPRFGSGLPQCTLLLGGVETPLPERAVA
ncbi:hypothetical protein POF50_007770 [Streptomyces sp. SL13]|uniref:Uncharacterized protein n=1 Tax=Streptantibioticus silvisoli TaxID=2705255 RepID=A0AA90GW83_9ACTN|nr:hypothetical protein [Streptantibioticus silvisoli]MDI5962612.1 hypothetical protein [Streptantibioticus silvisoli]MDI5969243.1 hypothetical protein [Streptantibioticus silvisoli]